MSPASTSTSAAKPATARLWIAYREGLRLLGTPVAVVPFEHAISRLDLAVWRFFCAEPPEEVPHDDVRDTESRVRVLVEVREQDLPDLSGYPPGCYESPYSAAEALRRLDLPPL